MSIKHQQLHLDKKDVQEFNVLSELVEKHPSETVRAELRARLAALKASVDQVTEDAKYNDGK